VVDVLAFFGTRKRKGRSEQDVVCFWQTSRREE
jgi:hypothetical protein